MMFIRSQRLVLAVAVLLVGIFSIQAGLVVTMATTFRAGVDAAIRDHVLGIGTAVSLAVSDGLRSGLDAHGCAELLRVLRDANRLSGAVLVEMDGRVIADATGDVTGRLTPLAADPRWLHQAQDHAVIQAVDHGDAPSRRAYVPVLRATAVPAVLVIDLTDAMPALGAGLRAPMLLGLAAATLATALVGLAGWLSWRLWQRSTRAAERASHLAAAGAVAAGLAHEVRNPLGTALASAELLARRAPRDGEDHQLIAGIVEAIGHANAQLTAFLDVVRDTPMRQVAVDLREIALSVAGMLRVRAEQAEMTLQVADGFPPPWLMGDPGRLRQAVVNIVLNAVEAGPAGGEVQIVVAAENGRLSLAVLDRGPGLPPAVLAARGEGFVTTKPGGTGLGLRLAQRTAQRHGGDLEITARAGGGTSVRFVFTSGITPR